MARAGTHQPPSRISRHSPPAIGSLPEKVRISGWILGILSSPSWPTQGVPTATRQSMTIMLPSSSRHIVRCPARDTGCSVSEQPLLGRRRLGAHGAVAAVWVRAELLRLRKRSVRGRAGRERCAASHSQIVRESTSKRVPTEQARTNSNSACVSRAVACATLCVVLMTVRDGTHQDRLSPTTTRRGSRRRTRFEVGDQRRGRRSCADAPRSADGNAPFRAATRNSTPATVEASRPNAIAACADRVSHSYFALRMFGSPPCRRGT